MATSADCGCDCGSVEGHCHGLPFRRFMSKQEIRERLERYEDELKKELAGVEERIHELEKS